MKSWRLKGVPLRYLKFSCALGGAICTRAHPCRRHLPCPGTGVGAVTVLFGLGHTQFLLDRVVRMQAQEVELKTGTGSCKCGHETRSYLVRPPLISRNRWLSTTEITVLTRTVWTVVAVLFIRMVVTVLSELLHPLNADQEAINSAPLTRSNIQHNNTQHSNKDWRKNLNLRVVQTEFLSLLSFLLQWIVLQIQT